jgi:hypothetical protein
LATTGFVTASDTSCLNSDDVDTDAACAAADAEPGYDAGPLNDGAFMLTAGISPSSSEPRLNSRTES